MIVHCRVFEQAPVQHYLEVLRPKHPNDAREIACSLHDDQPLHVWMQGTEVSVLPCGIERERVRVVGVECVRFERLAVAADYRMRNIVTIRPQDRRASRHCDRCR